MPIHQFKGIAKWPFLNHLDKFGKYSLQLYTNEANTKGIKALGLTKMKQKEDEDGTFWSLKLDPATSKFQKEVEVVTADGQPHSEAVGNGSEVIVDLDVYDYNNDFGKGRTHRLKKVTILNLVPYENKNNEVIPPPEDDAADIQVPADDEPAGKKAKWK